MRLGRLSEPQSLFERRCQDGYHSIHAARVETTLQTPYFLPSLRVCKKHCLTNIVSENTLFSYLTLSDFNQPPVVE